MSCARNFEDYTFEMGASLDEKAEGVHRSEDAEVNIMECTNSGDNVLVQAELAEATENSSSFGDTVSDIENGDSEVMSELRGDATSPMAFDGFCEVFPMRKKRLTSHWRTFIRPLMWRCKWVELQIKKLQSQGINYDREIAECNQRQQFELENFTLQDLGAKSLPFSSQSRRKKVMKRKKRKRVEDTIDVAAYMSHHKLFSCYENRKSTTDGAYLGDDWGNLVISTDNKINDNNELGASEELLPLEFRDGDNSLEQTLKKIGIVQLQVSKLKTRLNKVLSENAGKFCSTDNLSLHVPCNPLISSAQNLATPPNNGDRMPAGSSDLASQLMSEYNMGDLVMPESTVAHGEVAHLTDIIKSESTDQPRVWGACNSIRDGMLIYNEKAKEELKNYEEVQIQSMEKPKVVPKEEPISTIPPVQVLDDLHTEDQPPPKIRSISKLTDPKNKRKRGRRKAGSGRWSKKSSG